MKMKLKELRTVIASVLSEMPLVDITPPGRGREHPQFTASDSEKHQRSVDKYFRSPAFRRKAVRLYRNLSVPIYVVPVYHESFIDEGGNRVKAVPEPDWEETLEMYGVDERNIKQVMSGLSSGASAWIVRAATVRQETPTPWMIVHAMIDNPEWSVLTPLIDRIYKPIFDLIIGIATSHIASSAQSALDLLISSLTMGSARTGRLAAFNINDIASEIVTQELLDSRGFFFKRSSVPLVNEALEQIKRHLSGAREEFESLIAGRLLVLDVASVAR